MGFIFRIQELITKAITTVRLHGWKRVFQKIKTYFLKNLLGKNFSTYLHRGSYSLLWNRVFESYHTKGVLVFLLRFILVILFGWVVFFIKPREIDFVPDQKIISWYKNNKKKVTIIIPTYNDFQLTKNCVDSVLKFADPGYVEIVVVDDGSPAEIIKQLVETLPVKVIEKTKNEGFTGTVNTGLREAKEGDVVLLNNDTLVEKGWLEALQYWAYSEEKIGIVGPKLIYPDKTIQWSGSYRNEKERDWFDHLYRNKRADYSPSNFSHPVLAATGACMYIKESVLNIVGEFDPNFGMAFEDVDYSLRTWQAGFKVIYCPKSVVVHLESKTRGKRQGEREIKSRDYFWQKWHDWFGKRKVKGKSGKLKIVYVSQDNAVGGGPRVIFEHLNRLHQRGYEVALYTVDSPPDWFELEAPVKTFKNYEELKKDLSSQEALKVATWWETAQVVWEASLEAGIPVYLVQDVESSYYREDPDYADKVLASYRKEFNYLTVSSWNKEKLEELGIEATVVTPGVAEVFKRTHTKREKDLLLAVGRSHYLKNFDLTAKAWGLVKHKVKLKLFGVEPRLGKLLNVPYSYKPTDEEITHLYNKATVFIQTSLHEGFCLPLLEAMSCGCPVICTDADGNRDFYVNNKNCLLVKDDPKDVAEKIKKLFADKDLQEKLRKEGLKTATEFRWDKKIDDLETFYQNLAKKFSND